MMKEEKCWTMDLSCLDGEMVLEEMGRALLESDRPSVYFETLREMDQLDIWFPELKALIGVEQNPKHHAEGDVWVHTMMVLDEAVQFRDKVNEPLGFMLSVLTHDMGKAVCTKIVHGEVHAYDHEIAGIPLAEQFIRRLTDRNDLREYVMNMTELHMKPNTLAANDSSIKASNKLFDKSVDPEALVYIAIADGKGKIAPREYVSYDDFFEKRLAIFREYMSRPYVTEQDLLDEGFSKGEDFSEGLKFAHKLRLAGIDKENALKQTVSYINKLQSRKGKC